MPKRQPTESTTAGPIFPRISEILVSAAHESPSGRRRQVLANWLIGREIFAQRKPGRKSADYRAALLKRLSACLRSQFGPGYSVDNLEWFQKFYSAYPALLGGQKSDAARRISMDTASNAQAPRDQSWQPGQIHPKLSWTHYRTLSRLEDAAARAFYERETIAGNWSARELQRQIKSRRYQRSAPKKGKNRPPRRLPKGPRTQPSDVFEDPALKPYYDREFRELWVDGLCLHAFRGNAINEIAILEKLQAAGWPRRLFEPLGKGKSKKYRATLKETICRLNQCQTPCLIEFHSHPTDSAISWKWHLP